nr:transmembrane protein 8B-like [Cherax quadricarinatus]
MELAENKAQIMQNHQCINIAETGKFVCSAGWQGWGCEDGEAAQGWDTVITGLCLLTLSNIFFLPPTIIAARRHLYSQALLFTATMIASIFYHACDNEVVAYCVTKYEVLQFTDFFFSLLCFWVTVVGLGGIDEAFCPLLHTLGVVIIAPAVQYSRTALASFTVPMAFATAVPLCHIVYQRWRKGAWPSVQPRQLLYRCVGISLALVGLFMFALIQTKDNYKYIHSTWHVVIALSLVFLLPSRSQSELGLNAPSPVMRHSTPLTSDDAELIDVGETTVDYTASSLVFHVTSDVDFLLTDNEEDYHNLDKDTQ